MGVCSFDYKFQYILAGWEGSAADSRVLASALSRSDPLVVPPGMSINSANDYIVKHMINVTTLYEYTFFM